jgi:hypothetical protein
MLKIGTLNVDSKFKRESGENPERSRHCNRGVIMNCHWPMAGKTMMTLILEPGDLPILTTLLYLREIGRC